MNPSESQQRILAQYSSDAGRSLYRHVMGDGSDHIHYGLYADGAASMREALEASCRRLLDLALSRIDRTALLDILDLGAGAGGPAKCLLSWTDARMTCVDLGEPPLRDLEGWAEGAGLSRRLRTWRGSFGDMPAGWTESFDLVWSQDALCHAEDRAAVFAEARRVLRPGGVLVFSDILLAPDFPEQHARAFTAVNAVQHLGTAEAYLGELRRAGFPDIHCEDWSAQLPMNFRRMLGQVGLRRASMLREGVDPGILDRFAASLAQRLAWPAGQVLQWKAFLCRPG